MMKAIVSILVALAVVFGSTDAFVPSSVPAFVPRTSSSSTPLQMTVLSYNGKKKDFPEGSPLSKAVAALGAKVKYSCKKGDCATCQITLAGRYTKPCVAKVPPAPKLKSLQEKGLEIKV